jgi:hypothetical protein
MENEKMPNPWKTLSEKEVYSNPWIKISHHEVINPSGGKGIYGVLSFKFTCTIKVITSLTV